MARQNESHVTHMTIEIAPELRTRIAAAAERGVSERDYVVAVLRAALDRDGTETVPSDAREWARLSAPSFARDWNSDADAIYDDLA